MGVETCPSCDRTDVGDGHSCPSCGQLLRAPKEVKLASFEQRLRGFMLDGSVLFAAAIVGLLFLIELLDILFEPPNLLIIVLVVIGGVPFGIWSADTESQPDAREAVGRDPGDECRHRGAGWAGSNLLR